MQCTTRGLRLQSYISGYVNNQYKVRYENINICKENRSDSTYCKLLSLGKLMHAWMWNALFETVESAATKIAFKQNHSQKKDSFPGLWENAFRGLFFVT